MILHDYGNIDYTKYKRFFVFGCSFTNYIWPSWAEVIQTQLPNAEFYNVGVSGAGNQYITNKIAEINNRYKFCETDLVAVMYSTYCREDRYKDGNWITPGNIFTNWYYDEAFIKKYSDVKGYLIRDMALIDMSIGYLQNTPCDSIHMLSVPWKYQITDEDVNDLLVIYEELTKKMPGSLYEVEVHDPTSAGSYWKCGHTYYDPNQDRDNTGQLFGDYHPNTLQYMSYLEKIGFKFNEQALAYSTKSVDLLNQCKTRAEIELTSSQRLFKRFRVDHL